MKNLSPKLLSLIITFLLLLLTTTQKAAAQSTSFHDSLRHMLTYFYDSTKDEKLKNTVKGAQLLYSKDNIDDSLAKRLLELDSLLIIGVDPNRSVVLAYAQTLMQVFEQFIPIKEHPVYATSLDYLASLYVTKGQFEKALPLFIQALAIRKKVLGEEHPDYAASLNSLGILYVIQSKFEKALPLLLQALAIYKKVFGEEHLVYATSLDYLASLYLAKVQYEKALPLFLQAFAIIKKVLGEEHPDYAASLNKLAHVYRIQGQYEKALPLFQQALAIRRKVLGEEHPDYAASLADLAFIYIIQEQYKKALPLTQQALAIRRKVLGEEHPSYALSLHNLALLYSSMGQYEKALPLFQQALSIYKKVYGEEHPSYAISLSHLAGLYKKLGQYEKSLLLFQQVLSIHKKVYGEEHPEYALNLHNLAGSYQTLRQYGKALPLLQQALSFKKKVYGEEHPQYALTLTSLAALYSSTGNMQQVAALLSQAAAINLKHLTQTYTTLSESEKINFLNQWSSEFSYLPSILFTRRSTPSATLTNQAYQNELALKGMILQDQQAVLSGIRNSKDSTTLSLYEQWRSNKALLGKQLLLPIANRVPYLDSLTDATTQLEQQLSQASASFRSQLAAQKLTPATIAHSLQNDGAAIEFISFPLYNKRWTDSTMYAALILLPNDTIARFVPLFEEKQLKQLLQSSAIYHTASRGAKVLSASSSPAVAKIDSLYHLIWKPLEPYLTGIHSIAYAPAGLLHRIAFGALRSDATHYLIDKYNLQQVLSTRSIAQPFVPVEGSKHTVSASLWGNIDYNGENSIVKNNTPTRGSNGKETTKTSTNDTLSLFNFYNEDSRGQRGSEWVDLPGTKKEIDSLQILFNSAAVSTTTLSGSEATEEAFKAMDGKSPTLLHLATHGFFLPVKSGKPKDIAVSGGTSFTAQENPMFRSGLVLAGGNKAWKGTAAGEGKEDGILTAYEIAQMDLSGTDLVVLSACETALGDVQGNEGVIGLQRALKMAGVKQMMVSLWSVSDDVTAELMTSFYRSWLKGVSAREALQQAQLAIKRKHKNPLDWAPFTLVE